MLSDALIQPQVLAGDSNQGAGKDANPIKSGVCDGKRGRLITLAKRANAESNRRGVTKLESQLPKKNKGISCFQASEQSPIVQNVMQSAVFDSLSEPLKRWVESCPVDDPDLREAIISLVADAITTD